jgi:hypothetical protein
MLLKWKVSAIFRIMHQINYKIAIDECNIWCPGRAQ